MSAVPQLGDTISEARRVIERKDVLFSPRALRAIIAGLLSEVDRLNALVHTPETKNFAKGVMLEAVHQRVRWGMAHDRSKSAENWFWLVGYLAGKALRAAITGDREKAKHHCISSAAALANWHDAISKDDSGAGIGRDEDLDPEAVDG